MSFFNNIIIPIIIYYNNYVHENRRMCKCMASLTWKTDVVPMRSCVCKIQNKIKETQWRKEYHLGPSGGHRPSFAYQMIDRQIFIVCACNAIVCQ